MINDNKEVIGFMALSDHPNVPAVDPSDWEVWMRNLFQEEDNDDIVKLLGNNCPRLQDEYGDYYISEIIGCHPEMNRKIIVAEYQDHAVGVMCLNTEINYEMLQKTYDLTPFHGLRKSTPLEKEKYKRANMLLDIFGDPIMRGKWSPFRDNTNTVHVDSKYKDKSSKRSKSASKVNFDSEGMTKRSFEHFYYPNTSEDFSEKEINSPSLSVATNPSIMNFFLDDDAFEYEIVNIDKTLLTIPEGLSCDLMRTSSLFFLPDSNKKESKSSSERKSQIKIQHESPSPIKEVHVPKYHGGPNAFIIELFGLRDDIDDRKIRARKAEVMDIPQVSHLLQSLDGKETIWTVENTILNKNRLECFVFMSGTALIGVGILEQPEQIEFMRSKFNLDSLRLHKYHIQAGKNAGFVTLKAIVVYSVFEPHYRFFARELLRLSGNNSLLWLTAYKNKWVTHKANSLAGAMIPLTPRPTEIDCTSVPELRRIRNLSKTVDSSSYLFFTNVTLVSPDGLPYARRTKHTSEMMFEKYRLNSDKYLKSMPYTYYVNVVQGYLIDINKRGEIPLYTRLDIPQSNPEPIVSNFTPSNVFIVNSIHDANRALNFVKLFMWQDMDSINKSGMAYDGGILIDHEFKTKDPSIYAAGSVTKYYRKYQAENKRQKYYDAYEVGMTLGNQIRNKLDPLLTEVKNSEKFPRNSLKNVSFDETSIGNTSFNSCGSRESRDIEVCPDLPQFKKPLVLHCYLPGGLQYLEVCPPGKKLPHYYVQSLEYNGQSQGDPLAETVRNIGDSISNQSCKLRTKSKIRSRFEKSPYYEAITDYVIKWLSENDILLPMYLQPWQTTDYAHDVDKHPVFRKRRKTMTKMLSTIF
ncbi:unnamed protein product [Danaus chrysippus]|uniref:(African queen) hypothetical protein n=1 Tax=Danaus chrysippus TaxID=151541 RepID=A0A8J2R7Z2_9NEOP|nr:unnamed protein product [Danaus chrysippus]